MDFKQHIASIPGFPKEGIIFRDVTPLLEDKDAFKACIDDLAAHAKDLGADIVVGPESRGFIFGCPVALELGCGFVPIRKPGKLPRETVSKKYDLEYGSNEIFMHKDSIKPGMKVLIVDDNEINRIEAIICSMTKKERKNPKILNAGRRKRIAAGSGTTVQAVNKLMESFEMTQKMMKKMQSGNGMKNMMKNFKGINPNDLNNLKF